MAKKCLLVLVLAALVSTGAFAQLSAGGGLLIGGDLGGGIDTTVPGHGSVFKETNTNFGFGVYGFFDAKYVEASIAFWYGFGENEYTGAYVKETTGDVTNDTETASFNFSLLGKFPFVINKSFTIFPALGIEYQLVTSMKFKSGGASFEADSPGDFSALWTRLGVGLDYSLNDKMFLRFTALYGVRFLPTKYEMDKLDFTESIIDFYDTPGSSAETFPGHGPQIKAAVGFKF